MRNALILFLLSATLAHATTACPGLQPSIVDRAVSVLVQVESRGDPCAVGHAGEVGLTQISPRMVRELNRIYPQYHFTMADRSDPLLNVVMCKTWLGWARVHWHLKTVRALCEKWNCPYRGHAKREYMNSVDKVIKQQTKTKESR
jgi:hypothetical protein